MRPSFFLLAAACALPHVTGCSDSKGAAASPTLDADAGGSGPGATGDGGAASACAASGGPVVTRLSTDDGVALSADLYTPGVARGPAVVLLHMIPPSNDRSNYPAAFISALVGRGVAVLNVDRRGAGASEGVARDAYTGNKGALDAKAAVDFLGAHACAFDPDRTAIVGASNGTTTAVDYTVSAARPPRALVFLTGGTYTENQTKLAEHLPALAPIATMFVFSTAESAWSKAFSTSAPPAWRFEEYAKGAHGTAMFDAEPASVEAVAAFVAESLAPAR
jgi:pimeloyl-ACP methyl ester carboxylesterase